MIRSHKRKLASKSLTERRRQCRKRTHLRVVHRSKQFAILDQVVDDEPVVDF